MTSSSIAPTQSQRRRRTTTTSMKFHYCLMLLMLQVRVFVQVAAFVPQQDIHIGSSRGEGRHCSFPTPTNHVRRNFPLLRLYDQPPTSSPSSPSSPEQQATATLDLNNASSTESAAATPLNVTDEEPITTASGSFGNLLMKMQNRARRRRNRGGSSGSSNSDDDMSTDEDSDGFLELNATTTTGSEYLGPGQEEVDEELVEEDFVEDEPAKGTRSESSSSESETEEKVLVMDTGEEAPDFDYMDWETAQELDQAVTRFPSSEQDSVLLEGVVELPLDKRQLLGQQGRLIEKQRQRLSSTTTPTAEIAVDAIAQAKQETETNTTTTTSTTTTRDNALRSSRYYQRRTARDLTMCAVSIAANTDTVAEWRTACRLIKGIYPLVESAIRQGAAVLRSGQQDRQQQQTADDSNSQSMESSSMGEALEKSSSTAASRDYYNLNPQSASLEAYNRRRLEEEEASLQLACLACRAIRDLCAISPEMSAVVTDSLLRANQARNGGVMDDFRILLEYKHHYHASTSAAPTTSTFQDDSNRNSRFATRLFRRQRRRIRYRVQQQFRGLAGIRSERQIRQARRRRHKNRSQLDARRQCQLYVTQLLLAMTVASDHAVHAIRDTEGLSPAILACSSYTGGARRRRWLRYPGEMVKWLWRSSRTQTPQQKSQLRRPFLEAASLSYDLNGQIQRTANQVLAAIGCNQWVPKIPGQRGLRILALDGGGSRGMVSVTAVRCLVEAATNGVEVSDSFDMIVGTSTGGIIAFLTGLRRESSALAMNRYNQLIKQIFVKSALSTPLLLFTTASYDESRFMDILGDILQDESMLDSRADPAVPYVFAVTSKMSSTPTHIALFRNYNYAAGELPDPFTVTSETAREDLNLPLELEHPAIQSAKYPQVKDTSSSSSDSSTSGKSNSRRHKRGRASREQRVGSRHPGSFRVLQRYALRASTAAPTVFKPVMMGGEMYCDGGIVASNPAAVAIHEARALFPDIPIELIVSLGTGAFKMQKSPPRIGWDGIIGQIVDSATDAESVHHVLEDVLGEPEMVGRRSRVSQTRYYRFNPTIGLPEEFPIDVTDPEKLEKLRRITRTYMNEPEQKAMTEDIADILKGRSGWKKWWRL